jgi:hypothetical protein
MRKCPVPALQSLVSSHCGEKHRMPNISASGRNANRPNVKVLNTTKVIFRDIPDRDDPPENWATLEVNDAPPDGDRNGLRPIAGPEFVHDVLEVNLHGSFGYEQPVSDVAVAVALGYLL